MQRLNPSMRGMGMMKLHAERLVRLKAKSYVIFNARSKFNDDPDTWLNYPFTYDHYKVLFEEWADDNIPQRRGYYPSFKFNAAAVYFDNREDALMAYLAFR